MISLRYFYGSSAQTVAQNVTPWDSEEELPFPLPLYAQPDKWQFDLEYFPEDPAFILMRSIVYYQIKSQMRAIAELACKVSSHDFCMSLF